MLLAFFFPQINGVPVSPPAFQAALCGTQENIAYSFKHRQSLLLLKNTLLF